VGPGRGPAAGIYGGWPPVGPGRGWANGIYDGRWAAPASLWARLQEARERAWLAAAGIWEGNQGLGLGLVISSRWCSADRP
jgi:hypothetical protein